MLSAGGPILWNLATLERVWSTTKLNDDNNITRAVAFSPKGDVVALQHHDPGVTILNANDGSIVQHLKGDAQPSSQIAFSPDGTLLATGLNTVWNTKDWSKVERFDFQNYLGDFVEFSANGRFLVGVGYSNRSLVCRNVETGKVAWTAQIPGQGIPGIEVSQNSKFVAVTFNNEVRVYDLASGKLIRPASHGYATDFSISEDGAQIATSHAFGMVRIWDTFKQSVKNEWQSSPSEYHWSKSAYSVQFAKDNHLLTATKDQFAKLWNLSSNRVALSFKEYGSAIFDAQLSADETRLVTHKQLESTLTVWDVSKQKKLATLKDQTRDRIAIAPDGKHVLHGKSLREINTLEEVWTANDLGPLETGVRPAFRHDGRTIALPYSKDGQFGIAVVDRESGKSLRRIPTESRIRGLHFHPTKNHLISCNGGFVELWDVDKPKSESPLKRRIRIHKFAAQDVKFSPDGDHVVARIANNTLAVLRLSLNNDPPEVVSGWTPPTDIESIPTEDGKWIELIDSEGKLKAKPTFTAAIAKKVKDEFQLKHGAVWFDEYKSSDYLLQATVTGHTPQLGIRHDDGTIDTVYSGHAPNDYFGILRYKKDESLDQIWTRSKITKHEEAPFQLAMRVSGDRITLFVNGELKRTHFLDEPVHGVPGLFDDENSTTTYTDVKLLLLPERAPESPPEKQNAFAKLRREDIAPYELKVAGMGDPANAPKELVAVLGQSRLQEGVRVQFTPDSSQLISYGSDVVIWDVETALEVHRLHGSVGAHSKSIALSKDGRRLYAAPTASYGDAEFYGWELPTGEVCHHLDRIRKIDGQCIRFSHDGQRLLAAISGGTGGATWFDARTLKRQQSTEATGVPTRHIAIAPDGKTSALGGDAGKVTIINNSNGKILKTLQSGPHNVSQLVAFSPDGKLLAVSAAVLSTDNWEIDARFKVDGLSQFSADGKWLISCGGNGIQAVDAASGEAKWKRTFADSSNCHDMCISPNSKLVAVAQLGVRILDIDTGKDVHHVSASTTGFDVAPSGAFIATTHNDGLSRIWDVVSGSQLQEWKSCDGVGDRAIAFAVTYSRTKKLLVTGNNDQHIKIWDKDGKLIRKIRSYGGAVRDVQWTPDGSKVIAIQQASGYAIQVYDVQTGKLLSEAKDLGHAKIGIDPTGRFIMHDNTLREIENLEIVWTSNDLVSNKNSGSPELRPRPAFRSDGKLIAVSDQDKAAIVNAKTGAVVRRLQSTWWTSGLDFHPTKNRLVTCGGGFVELWDLDKPIDESPLIRRIRLNRNGVEEVKFSPDGDHVVARNSNNTLSILRLSLNNDPPEVVSGWTKPTDIETVTRRDGKWIELVDANGNLKVKATTKGKKSETESEAFHLANGQVWFDGIESSDFLIQGTVTTSGSFAIRGNDEPFHIGYFKPHQVGIETVLDNGEHDNGVAVHRLSVESKSPSRFAMRVSGKRVSLFVDGKLEKTHYVKESLKGTVGLYTGIGLSASFRDVKLLKFD